MLADGAAALIDVGAAAGALVAIIGAVVLVTRLRPVKWLWRTLVSEPLSRWFRAQVREEVGPAVQELSPNGGESFRDLVLDRLSAGEAHFEKLDGQVSALEERTTAIARQLGAAPPPGTP